MGSRGPKQKPAELLRLHGSWRAKQRGNGARSMADLATGKPQKPTDLDPIASNFWDEIVPKLVRLGLARRVDAPSLQALAEIWSLYRRSVAIANANPIDKDARIAVTSYKTAFDSLASKFGLTPRDRERMDAPRRAVSKRNRGKEGALEKFLSEGRDRIAKGVRA